MLTDQEVALLREELATAKNPLFLYDGDGDGLTSFLLLYKIHREGKGIALTATSILDQRFSRKVAELNPDKIFVLDVPVVTQEFIDEAKRPIFWIDHHPPQPRTNMSCRFQNRWWSRSSVRRDSWILTSSSGLSKTRWTISCAMSRGVRTSS